ncbi:LOW QUALITY PROTEIN: pre-rRNA-processing protein TSR2 homolog [Dromiciops gliroides]|uniref:LOW QUALITY PROTEIN: pre-rRNA-processing protein TSR2 homolog n=1 Tax=Dromiciops gliroides TaxID=33562 RepID=UPI001CC66AFC|nr:LOW QUALITY PROTEIN: pre-rRNA-processing protein TSR2 homolog [Dromiciops gliroides]
MVGVVGIAPLLSPQATSPGLAQCASSNHAPVAGSDESEMAASAEQASTWFSVCVPVMLEAWPALRIAVENGFRGVRSLEKALWLRAVVEDCFIQNSDLEQGEVVEDFLSDIMSTEFDTLVEDGSLPQVSQQLQTVFRYCQSAEGSLMRELIAHIGQKQMEVQATEFGAVDQTSDKDSDQEARTDGGAEKKEVTHSTDAPSCPVAPRLDHRLPLARASLGYEAAEDGWIVIQGKKINCKVLSLAFRALYSIPFTCFSMLTDLPALPHNALVYIYSLLKGMTS